MADDRRMKDESFVTSLLPILIETLRPRETKRQMAEIVNDARDFFFYLLAG